MNPRMTSTLARFALTLVTLSLFACVQEPEGVDVVNPEYGEADDGTGALVDATCFSEEPGCGCVTGTPPVTCTITRERGDFVLCEAGASYCVDGLWSACETVESWEMPRPKVITAPGACSACNPDCFVTDDEPDQGDIDMPPDGITSDNVEFTLGPPRGIRPIADTSTSMGGVDTDMDGVPDSADDCPAMVGTAAFFGCPTGVGTGGFFHVLPPGASAVDPISFDVQLREADIYILIDRTGSMGGEIDNLRTGLASMINSIRATIPDTWFGVGRFDDLPMGGYGTTSSTANRVYYNLQDLTSSVAAAQAAVTTLATIPSGGDWPEANSQALYAMASGNGLNIFGTNYIGARTGCPAGRWGYPCFRPNVIPLVILITDAESHNGPTGIQYVTSPTNVNAGSMGNNNTNVNIGNVTNTQRTYTGGTGSATNDFTVRCGTASTADNSRDRAVTFTVATAGTYYFDLGNSSYDTMLGLYNGSVVSTANLIECDDDDGSGDTSYIERFLNPGTYTLRIDGHSSDNGNFEVRIGHDVSTPGGITYAMAMAAMNARNIRFIGVNSGNSVARADLESMAADTNSLDGSGNAFVEDIASDGSGLSNAIVTAVENLANYSRMDVDVVVENVDLLPGVPASALVQSITLGAPGCAGRCTGAITNGCSQCLPGTTLPFSVTFANNVITPTAVDQVFNFDLIVRGNLGDIELQRVPVRIVVPANAPTTTYMAGTFSRTFAAEDTCEIPPTRPDWGLFQWEVATPGDSSVVFQFRTAESEAELNGMSPVTYAVPAGPDVPTAAQFLDVGALITSMGGQNYLPFLRVTAVLNPSTDGTQAPTLTSMGLQYGCVDSE